MALVMGNGAYADSPLRNPVNDALDMSSVLRRLGFSVVTATDQTRSQMVQAIRDFGRSAAGAEAALFFYAGHGAQVRGRNYLFPIDQRFSDEGEVESNGVELSTVLFRLEAAAPRVSVLIIDACRNSPFVRSGRSATRGLARVDAPSGALVAFAAQPGAEAADGNGRNGVYTSSLLRHMTVPGLTIEQVFKRVRSDVERETGGRQSPREESSLKGSDFFFRR